MIINIHEAGNASEDLTKRVEELEQANEDITKAFELLLKKLMSQMGTGGPLEPCDCGNPNCPQQAAYEAQQEQAPNSVGGNSGSGGQYI